MPLSRSVLTLALKLALIPVLLGLGLGIWAFWIEPRQLVVKEYEIHLKDWPADLAGFTIAFVTDPHVGSLHVDLAKLQRVVDRTNARTPDLILMGGDYVVQGGLGGRHVPSEQIIPILGQLKAKYGVYGILGNHDWWDNGPRMKEQFAAHGIPMLENTSHQLTLNGHPIWLVGVSDFSERRNNIEAAFAGVPANGPNLVLTHTPDILPELPDAATLTFAGHTHGGQVYIPFLGRPVLPSNYGQRYALGHITEGAKQLFVGSGIGTSLLPVRFLTPPEISLLKIYPAP
ncbi:MAG: metallophosphoesterase [Pseudomonas fluorescens]|nr:MAG: metallophosphoesterase [Pseudomonas fluorescens]